MPSVSNADYRLPTDLKPTHYDLVIQTDLNNLTFAGHVAIELDVLSDTKMLVLNAAKTLELKQTRVFVDDKAADVSDTQMLEHERLSIELKGEIKKGQRVRLELAYASSLNEDDNGACIFALMGYSRLIQKC